MADLAQGEYSKQVSKVGRQRVLPFYLLTHSLPYYLLTSRKGHGRWGLRAKPGGGWEDDLVVIQARHSYLKEVGRELGGGPRRDTGE